MHDRVADVLTQRAALDRGAGIGVALSLLLHGGLTALAVYAALHAPPSEKPTMVSIQFAKIPASTPAIRRAESPPRHKAPKIEDVKPKIEQPKPEPPKQPEKNTVPLSPFGRSTKKGAEEPAPAPPKPAAGPAAPDIPVGGAGVTGIEGGDFPYTLYIESMQRRIGANWYRGTPPAGIEVVVYFRIRRDGTITDVRVDKPSGNGPFDRAAVSAVRSSSPLNPLPFAYSGTYLGVHLTFK